jgi:hypothetical protein
MFGWYHKLMLHLSKKVDKILEGSPVRDAYLRDTEMATTARNQARRTIYRAQYTEFMAVASLQALESWHEQHIKPRESEGIEDTR